MTTETDSRLEAPRPTFVQYARHGAGYVPLSDTVRVLPSGVYRLEWAGHEWVFAPTPLVTDKLARLPDSKSDEVIAEIEKFWTLRPAFRELGLVHKRGFLLWGPPGSGKTSTLAYVTGQMVRRGGLVLICDVEPSTLTLMLGRLRQVEADRPLVVVLEDIDTLIEEHGEAEVLALLDGEASIDGVVYLATTNYPEKLDGRLVDRPSRFDQVVRIGMPSPEARRAYLQSRNLGFGPREVEQWVELSEGFSIAHLKELIVGVRAFGRPLQGEVERLRKMSAWPKSDGAK